MLFDYIELKVIRKMSQTLISTLILFIGRLLIAWYFLKAGYSNLRGFSRMVGVLRQRQVPFPIFALTIALILQIGGALSVLFNYYVAWGASALILFTLGANYYFCRYWLLQNAERRHVQFLFYANLAVIGGLLLLIVR